jgi:DNA-binding transcriptional regulator YiaG
MRIFCKFGKWISVDLGSRPPAVRNGLEVETARNWEMERREPDMTAQRHLRVIWNDPKSIERA